MSKFQIYGNRTSEETTLELENRKLAKEAASEAIVLLRNDNNVLPLKTKKVALYGAGARLTIKGGSGSGDVHERYNVNIEDGLKNNGLEILSTSWLERFTTKYEQDKKDFKEMVEKEIKGYPVWKVMAMFDKIHEFKLAYPQGDEIKEEDLSKDTDTAIYVISRQAGEGDDRKLEKGDYLLADVEVNNIKTCVENYKHVIVVINCGSSLDLSPIIDLNIEAILYYGQAGEEGGNALGEILTGKVTPSGKLTDTWANDYFDYPSAREVLNPEVKLEENYYEGIYVGYRWFDAKNINPLFPFGFGLSYTTFEHKVNSINVEKNVVTVKVDVKNIGKEYSGKEIIQLYLSKPNNKYDGEKYALVAFNKTKLLKPNEEESLTLSFDIKDFATYDEVLSSYVLEEGHYQLSVGNSSDNITSVCLLDNAHDFVVEKCKKLPNSLVKFEDFYNESLILETKELPIYPLVLEETKVNKYEYKVTSNNTWVNEKLNLLNDKELAMYTMGGGYFTKTYNKVGGACGFTTSLLVKKGIPNIVMSDGPAGLNLMQKVAYSKGGSVRYVDELPEDWQWGWINKVMKVLPMIKAKPNKHTYCYQYCTAWPNATDLAQTWNIKLVENVGKAVGQEMLVMGVTLWLAPALNIHRNPLCGRNFEYYSEDPLISGSFAAAITRGVQSNGGVGVTIKHFACNNRENDRMQVSSNLSERAFREIYLKGFRIVCKDQPYALMSSYNRINGVYAPNNRELLIDILRCEWGYQGLVMSDWNAVDQCSNKEAILSGNNMIMPGRKDVYKDILKSLNNKKIKKEDLLVGATYALELIYKAKTTKDFLK